jgi:DNA-binding IscR family transcriptional regulator
MGIERRETGRRAAVVRAVVDQVVQNPNGCITLEGLRDSLHIPAAAATRIVERLVSAGLVREVGRGVWERIPSLPVLHS